jgi:hypothetical protein
MGFAKGIDWVARAARLRVLNLITLSSGSPTARLSIDSGLRYWLLSINYLHVWGNEKLRLLAFSSILCFRFTVDVAIAGWTELSNLESPF